MSRIAVVGTGYVGSTTAACMASLGHDVVGIDIDADKVARLNAASVDIFEPGLVELLRAGMAQNRLAFTVDFGCVADVEFVFLCVPTPPSEDGGADLTHLLDAVRSIAELLPPDSVVINKSTVPVGSAERVRRELGRDDVHVVSNPEFLREGHAVQDCLRPDRLVIGSDDDAVTIRVFALYRGIVTPLVATDPATAELTKYAANAFLAMKISFMNEISTICERVGADVLDVASGLGHDARIGARYLQPGPGWGGSCLPKDTRALDAIAARAGHDFRLLRAAIDVNDDQMDRVVDQVRKACGGDLRGSRVCVWGLSFKEGTADVRESPAVRLVDRLLAAGSTVSAHDPQVGADALDRTAVALSDEAVDAARDARVLVVMTAWEEYRWVDFPMLARLMDEGVIVDARNHLNRGTVITAGLDYVGFGRSRAGDPRSP